jgi:hypothetical protein
VAAIAEAFSLNNPASDEYQQVQLQRLVARALSSKESNKVFTNFANSRRDHGAVMFDPERFEGLTNWRWDCTDEADGTPNEKGAKPWTECW